MSSYLTEKESWCTGIGEQCLYCLKRAYCAILREQLSFYERLQVPEVTRMFEIPSLQKPDSPPKQRTEGIDHKRRIDPSWDFADADTKTLTHCLHNYPAMMIPQVAGRLLDLYSQAGDVVLDPFCGSGTVLVESKLRGLHSYGLEINPLALLLSRVKTTPLDVSRLRLSLRQIVEHYVSTRLKDIEMPDFWNITYWFKPRVIQHLTRLRNAIASLEDAQQRDFFCVAFSETVREVSNTRNSEFKLYRIPPEKLAEFMPDVLGSFSQKAVRNIAGMEEFCKRASSSAKATVLEEDTRYIPSLSDHSVDLIVTSPPYGDSKTTVAYGQFSRLSLQWLGFSGDDLKTDVKSLGGKARRTLGQYHMPSDTLKKTVLSIAEIDQHRAREVLVFFLDMKECFKQLKRVLRPEGRMCMVVGNRTVKGIEVPMDVIVVELGVYFEMEHIETIVRNIPNKRMPKRNSPSNVKGITESTMNQEYIVIMRRKETI